MSFWIVHQAWSTSEPRSPRTSRNSSEAEQSKSPLGNCKISSSENVNGETKPKRVRPADRPTFKHAFACGKVGKHDGSAAAKLYCGDRPQWSRDRGSNWKLGNPLISGRPTHCSPRRETIKSALMKRNCSAVARSPKWNEWHPVRKRTYPPRCIHSTTGDMLQF